jgi:hypothetical protein
MNIPVVNLSAEFLQLRLHEAKGDIPAMASYHFKTSLWVREISAVVPFEQNSSASSNLDIWVRSNDSAQLAVLQGLIPNTVYHLQAAVFARASGNVGKLKFQILAVRPQQQSERKAA